MTLDVRFEPTPNHMGVRRLLIRRAEERPRDSAADAADPRLERAARWVLELDAQFARMVEDGREVPVPVASRPRTMPSRAADESPGGYRALRLRPGDLVRPWLFAPPSLEPLYPFQRIGVEWLGKQCGAILADDMGLGKTVQVIFALRRLFQQAKVRSALVACPKSLVEVWEREFLRWAPELGVAVMTPPARIRDRAWTEVVGRRHVLITNYEQLREPPQALLGAPLDLLAADEAHRLRNFGAQVTGGIDQLRRRRFWALTGTPIERDLEDLATLLSLIEPTRFSPDHARLHPSSLRSMARPYILRRLKDEVLGELPPVIDKTEKIDLTPEQAEAYVAAAAGYRQSPAPGAELALLTKLRSYCDFHEPSGCSSKLDWIMDRLADIREQGEKAVAFSYRLAPLHELERRVASRWRRDAVRRLEGAMSAAERARAVDAFRADPNVLALVASSRVGGEGLTLVEANHVFLISEWWNPSANDQARDRVVRIGQTRTVHVYRFCCRNTVEERLQEILAAKRDLFEAAVGRLDSRGVLAAVLREAGLESLIGAVELL